MDSNPPPASPPVRWRRLLPWLVAVAALVYAWTIYKRGSPFAAGSDSSGYLNSARLLAHGQVTTPVRELPGYPPPWPFYSHVPLGFILDQDTRLMAPTYPIGLPLHLAALAPVVGWEKTARVLNVLNVLAAAGLLYGLARRLQLSRGWALAAVAALWASPLWFLYALQPMSDCLSVTWCLVAIAAGWRSRTRRAWGLVAGLAIGIAVLIRPANLVIVVPVAVLIGWNWRAAVGLALGGIPCAAAFFAYNAKAYGDPLVTGYGTEHTDFALTNVPHNLVHFALWLPILCGVPVALAALGWPWVRRKVPDVSPGGTTRLLVTWLGAFVALYATYYFAGETWWYVRYLLPAMPALILAGVLVLQHLARARARLAVGLLLLGLAGQIYAADQLINYSVRDGERRYYRACQWLDQNLPRNAIVASCQLSGAQFYYTPFALIRWDQVPPDEFEKIARAAVAHDRPIYAALFHFEEDRARAEHLRGRWTRIHDADDVAVWRFDGLDGGRR